MLQIFIPVYNLPFIQVIFLMKFKLDFFFISGISVRNSCQKKSQDLKAHFLLLTMFWIVFLEYSFKLTLRNTLGISVWHSGNDNTWVVTTNLRVHSWLLSFQQSWAPGSSKHDGHIPAFWPLFLLVANQSSQPMGRKHQLPSPFQEQGCCFEAILNQYFSFPINLEHFLY